MNKNQNTAFHFQGRITGTQLAFFQKNGFIHFKNFISREMVAEFINEVENVQQHLLSGNISKVNGVPLKFGHDVGGRPIIQRLAFASQYSKRLQQFLQDPRLQFLLPFLGNYEGRISEKEKDGLVVNHYVNTPLSKLCSSVGIPIVPGIFFSVPASCLC
jgi:phytanoyl-CoA hydroxylase